MSAAEASYLNFMKNIFVFCAYHKRAQENYAKSILQPVPTETVLRCFAADQHSDLLAAQADSNGFYAWGFKAGIRLVNTFWRKIEPGDLALGFFSRHYRVAAKLLLKVESETLANTIWSNRPDIIESYRLVVLLSKPHFIQVPAADLTPHLPSEYRGAVRMNEERVKKIVEDFGSLEHFVHLRICPSLQTGSNEN